VNAARLAALDDLLRRFAGAVKAVHLYTPEHPLVRRALDQLAESLERLLVEETELVMGIVDGQLVVDGQPVLGGPGTAETLERLAAGGVERLAVLRGVTAEELARFVRRLPVAGTHRAPDDDGPGVEGTDHIRVSRLRVRKRAEGLGANVHAAREVYRDAVARAEQLWHQAAAEGAPDPALAKEVVDGLAHLMQQNRRGLVALTALCQYDNYTFTHMVNVGVLTMAQARSVGIEGATLRQFGLAGLMHDLGKIRTPREILAKPDKLSDDEFAIMKRHPVDGAEILRRQIEMPPLAAVVAFEHHLRIDGTGYPEGVRRPSLNVATQMCAIADVYDAMRSQRAYQDAYPTDRILAVLEQNDGKRFDQHLVRRFSQLMGIYPPGNMVRLDTGAIAVVLRTHAPDPARPAVRVVIGPSGDRLAAPVDLALWDDESPAGPPPRIVTPVNPADFKVDPLEFLDPAA
jgi:putative nucleotidyltransferase with HDIG domain